MVHIIITETAKKKIANEVKNWLLVSAVNVIIWLKTSTIAETLTDCGNTFFAVETS